MSMQTGWNILCTMLSGIFMPICIEIANTPPQVDTSTYRNEIYAHSGIAVLATLQAYFFQFLSGNGNQPKPDKKKPSQKPNKDEPKPKPVRPGRREPQEPREPKTRTM